MNVKCFGNEPRRSTADAAGADLISANTVWLTRSWERVKTGTHVAIPSGHVGLLMPRSSLALRGADMVVGVIDADYRGEISCVMRSVGGEVLVQAGDRVAQLLIVPVAMASFVGVDSAEELGETGRGQGGFGSTGR